MADDAEIPRLRRQMKFMYEIHGYRLEGQEFVNRNPPGAATCPLCYPAAATSAPSGGRRNTPAAATSAPGGRRRNPPAAATSAPRRRRLNPPAAATSDLSADATDPSDPPPHPQQPESSHLRNSSSPHRSNTGAIVLHAHHATDPADPPSPQEERSSSHLRNTSPLREEGSSPQISIRPQPSTQSRSPYPIRSTRAAENPAVHSPLPAQPQPPAELDIPMRGTTSRRGHPNRNKHPSRNTRTTRPHNISALYALTLKLSQKVEQLAREFRQVKRETQQIRREVQQTKSALKSLKATTRAHGVALSQLRRQ